MTAAHYLISIDAARAAGHHGLALGLLQLYLRDCPEAPKPPPAVYAQFTLAAGNGHRNDMVASPAPGIERSPEFAGRA